MRRLVALIAVTSMFIMAGCLGGGVVDETALEAEAEYDWNTSSQASVTITDGSYQAVLSLDNRSNVSLFGPGEFGGEAALRIEAVKYRSPNGTVYNASALTVEEVGERTVIEAPRPNGQIAYTAAVHSSDLFLPVAVNGSHQVTVPPGNEIGFPIVGGATPGGYEVERSDERITLVWEDPQTDLITVDYYQERNLYIFAGLLGIGGLVAAGGVLYFRSQLRVLAMKRGDLGPEMAGQNEDQREQ